MALAGLKVAELLGMPPQQFAAMVMADFGADVVVVEDSNRASIEAHSRGKKKVHLDIKKEAGAKELWRMLKSADILIDPFRPGVLERLGFGYEALKSHNPRLILAQLTGYGQKGPQIAGHDLSYISYSGSLGFLGPDGQAPYPPANLIADFGGGALMLTMGVLMALYERNTSGLGQVVDLGMLQGSAYFSSFLHSAKQLGFFPKYPGQNLLDGGAPFYQVYRWSDEKFLSVACLEPKFYKVFMKMLSNHALQETEEIKALQLYLNQDNWKEGKQILSQVFMRKSRDEWIRIFDGSDACVAPVLSQEEALQHPLIHSLNVFGEDGIPNPQPFLSRTPGRVISAPKL